jgi:hypothetical protein
MGEESSGNGDGASICDLGDSAPQGEKGSGRGKSGGRERDGGWKRERAGKGDAQRKIKLN